MIEARGLVKRYGSTTAVDNLSFDVRPGTVTGFLGPNGAGKSTTMRMMIGLDQPDAGTVRINGKDYRDLRSPLREVGALLEAKAFHPGRTARAHLAALAASNDIPRRRVNDVLEITGLDKAADRRAGKFSLGMAQRLGIAAALLGDPAVLLLDEPVNGLDPEGIRWIRNLLKNLATHGRTVLVSSHLISEVAQTADQLIVIGQGRLLAQTTVAELSARSSSAGSPSSAAAMPSRCAIPRENLPARRSAAFSIPVISSTSLTRRRGMPLLAARAVRCERAVRPGWNALASSSAPTSRSGLRSSW